MGSELTPLQELAPGLSSSDPTYGHALLHADPDTLSAAARQLRRHFVDAVKASNRPAIVGPSVARDMLRRSLLQPAPERWTLYALGPDRRTVQEPRPAGGTRNVTKVAYKVPPPEDLPPLPHGGRWLVIWHGSPDVLSIDGVPQRLQRLQAKTLIADVLFYDRDETGSIALYSLKLGRGAVGDRSAEFPDPAALAAARRSS